MKKDKNPNNIIQVNIRKLSKGPKNIRNNTKIHTFGSHTVIIQKFDSFFFLEFSNIFIFSYFFVTDLVFAC